MPRNHRLPRRERYRRAKAARVAAPEELAACLQKYDRLGERINRLLSRPPRRNRPRTWPEPDPVLHNEPDALLERLRATCERMYVSVGVEEDSQRRPHLGEIRKADRKYFGAPPLHASR